MARLPRYTIKNQPQHIIQRSIDNQKIFLQDQDFQYYHDCLEAAAFNYNLQVHAYVLMPDHTHILATPGNVDSVSRTLQSLGRNYVQYYNECYDQEGTPWEGRYRATVIDGKDYMLTCTRYIETNPVRAGLTKNPKDYQWSSYANNAQARLDEMITASKEYAKLGSTAKDCAKAYRELLKQKLSSDVIDTITESTLHGWALGNAKFAQKIEKQCGRRATPLPKGRPKGS